MCLDMYRASSSSSLSLFSSIQGFLFFWVVLTPLCCDLKPSVVVLFLEVVFGKAEARRISSPSSVDVSLSGLLS